MLCCKPHSAEASLALPEKRGASVGWSVTRLNPLSVQKGETAGVQTLQLHVLAPVAWGWSRPCWGPQGGGPAALTWSFPCHCTPYPTPLSEICMTKSSRPSKDCPGRVRTPVGFSSPSVGSRNPAPSSCESPQGCGTFPQSPATSATTASPAPRTLAAGFL